MKSKQELIEEWESAIEAAEFYGKGKEERLISYMKDFVSDLKQLDEPEANSQIDKLANFIMGEVEGEPSQNQGAVDTAIRIIKFYQNREVLSQKWIAEHEKREQYTGPFGNEYIQYVVPSRYLQNKLVPKQGLPTIPKFMAEFIEDRKGTDAYSLKYILSVSVERNEREQHTKAYDWIADNDELFARAWLYGYTVEEEHTSKYVVQTNTGTYLMLDTSKREWDYTPLPPHDDDAWFAHKFDDRDVAEGIAKIINGTVVELEERKPTPTPTPTINASDPFGASQIGDLIDP